MRNWQLYWQKNRLTLVVHHTSVLQERNIIINPFLGNISQVNLSLIYMDLYWGNPKID